MPLIEPALVSEGRLPPARISTPVAVPGMLPKITEPSESTVLPTVAVIEPSFKNATSERFAKLIVAPLPIRSPVASADAEATEVVNLFEVCASARMLPRL